LGDVAETALFADAEVRLLARLAAVPK